METKKTEKIVTYDVTNMVGSLLEKSGYGSDSNTETEITKAGIWDLMDSLAGKGRFTKEQASAEMERRGCL